MTLSEAYNMGYKLIMRAGVCMNYAAGTTKPLLVVELEAANQQVADLKKDNTALTARVEELTKAAEDAKIKAKAALDASQKKVVSLQSSVETLQTDLDKAKSDNAELLKDKVSALAERDTLLKEKLALEDQVCQERELGFQQGIGQCHYFYNTPLEDPNFDIMKLFVDGKLVDLGGSASPTAEETSPIPTTAAPADATPP
ncbi:uncharacterized protein LOC111242296 [Vigna radiata var. radiata]|uniref:Uncharacterized protein LOC111242296 n=1 Tax=Vigna radiata var. radiata TaxID=3916 RepID=A0A3Q0FDZ1_VIGRR|nr:uncharacterized protein LOC111242296 [Vigna radiata var. radiata]